MIGDTRLSFDGKEFVDILPLLLYHVIYDHMHGSLEGVGGLNTNEAYRSKADTLLIPEM